MGLPDETSGQCWVEEAKQLKAGESESVILSFEEVSWRYCGLILSPTRVGLQRNNLEEKYVIISAQGRGTHVVSVA